VKNNERPLFCGLSLALSVIGCSEGATTSTQRIEGGERKNLSTDIVWTESSDEPVAVSVHRQIRDGVAPDEYTIETGTRFVRRDLAVTMPDFEEEDDQRSVEQIAEDARIVVLMDGVEYISDPDVENAKLRKAGVRREAGTPPSPDSAGTEDHEELQARQVVGSDNRYSLDSVAQTWPDSTHVEHFGGQVGTCSGTHVGRFTQVTAAHCLNDGDSWFSPISNLRAGQGSAGSVWTAIRGGNFSACWAFAVPGGWDEDHDVDDDFGVVDMRGCQPPDQGWLGTSNTVGWDTTHYLNGYPAIPPSGVANRLWGANNGSAHSHTGWTNTFFHEIDATDGQSGAGIYRRSGATNRYVVAVHRGAIYGVYDENYGRTMDWGVWDLLMDFGFCQTPGFETCP
jgi:V8-like Glu-specific endopeptidase